MEHHLANRSTRDGFAASAELRPYTAPALLRAESFAGSSQLADRIRELCARVVASEGHYPQILAELRYALHEHNRRLRFLAARKLVSAGRLPG